MKKATAVSVVSLLLIPLTLYLGTILPGRGYYVSGSLMILQAMLPFFLLFEARRPQARELVTIAVLCALAAVSRVAFVIPNFKPTTAIIMLAGIAFGPQAGFLTGSVAAFASNLFYSQGPWTPWQMMAYGMGGFLAGAAFHGKGQPNVWLLGLFGFGAIMAIVGPLLDCCTLFTMASVLSWETAALVFAQGLPMNFTHALSCAATMMVLGRPLLGKLERLKRKYGMMENLN